MPTPRFGAYQLLLRIAYGGVAEIFLAQDPAGALAVLKLLHPHLSHDRAVRQAFNNEGELLARLAEPLFPKYLGRGEIDGVPYLAQEWIAGVNLATLLEWQGATPWPAAAVAALILPIAECLTRLNEGALEPFVHRDLSLNNLLLDRHGLVRVADLGLAKGAGRASTASTGLIKGTPGFMAPEQARGERTAPAADVFALGAVSFRLLTGEPLYSAASAHWTEAARGPGNVAQRYPEEIPAAFRELVTAMLEADPSRRPSANNVAKVIDGLAGSENWDVSASYLRQEIWSKAEPRFAALLLPLNRLLEAEKDKGELEASQRPAEKSWRLPWWWIVAAMNALSALLAYWAWRRLSG